MQNNGQKTEDWANFWNGLTPESEVQMWDYYGGRPWILKYVPRFGKVCEAGCGLGRYVFYLSKLGINCEGLDFEFKTIDFLNNWKKNNNFDAVNFIHGDVTNLPYEDNTLSGYISLGVIEHFIEGPQKPIKEAYRVLRSGGIAIITTPSLSWSKLYLKLIGRIKNIIKRILRREVIEKPFFQYEYRPKSLKKHLAKSGFFISRYRGVDWLLTFTEVGRHTDKFIKSNKIGYKISHWLENSWLSFLGAQSIVIALKADNLMHCFFCGEKTAVLDSLNEFDVPICKNCENNDNVIFYKKNKKMSFHKKYLISSSIKVVEKKRCDFCANFYKTDELFEDFGFDKNVCPTCLKKKNINILLSNTSLQPIWRKRALK